jgi:hypothetical protein
LEHVTLKFKILSTKLSQTNLFVPIAAPVVRADISGEAMADIEDKGDRVGLLRNENDCSLSEGEKI